MPTCPLLENWFTILQSAGIIGSLLFGATAIREDARARRAESFLRIASEHRRIWAGYHGNPSLQRVLSPEVDLNSRPVTPEERIFVRAVMLHANATFQANKLGSLDEPEGARSDVRNFFSLPIPATVYATHRALLDEAFVRYVDDALESSA